MNNTRHALSASDVIDTQGRAWRGDHDGLRRKREKYLIIDCFLFIIETEKKFFVMEFRLVKGKITRFSKLMALLWRGVRMLGNFFRVEGFEGV